MPSRHCVFNTKANSGVFQHDDQAKRSVSFMTSTNVVSLPINPTAKRPSQTVSYAFDICLLTLRLPHANSGHHLNHLSRLCVVPSDGAEEQQAECFEAPQKRPTSSTQESVLHRPPPVTSRTLQNFQPEGVLKPVWNPLHPVAGHQQHTTAISTLTTRQDNNSSVLHIG